MSHAAKLLAIIEREKRLKAVAEGRRARLARLPRRTRDVLERAEATLDQNHRLMADVRRWNVYFRGTGPRRR